MLSLWDTFSAFGGLQYWKSLEGSEIYCRTDDLERFCNVQTVSMFLFCFVVALLQSAQSQGYCLKEVKIKGG